ncbi:MAG: hypothetical protein H0S79_24290, partial [Anaerolineaceae bacterium]|nr:hypothetical protein [Anaerolineaceae bacterium]
MEEQPKPAPKKRISTFWFVTILVVLISLCVWFAIALGNFYEENILPP